MKKVLITGISGFIGQYLFRYAPQNIQISGTYYKNKPVNDRIMLLNLDLSDIDIFISNTPAFDVIIHTAAESNLKKCEDNPDLAMQVNAEATKKLAQWSEEQGSRFIYFSTDIVFKGDKGNYIETDVPEPVNYYGKSKLAGEENIHEIHTNYVIARIALCLGKGLGKSESFTDWMEDKIHNNEEMNLFFDEYRSPVSVDYIAGAVWEFLKNNYIGIIHLSGNERIDRYSIGKQIVKYFPNYNENFLKKSSVKNMNYPRPKDVSMNSKYADKVLHIQRKKITDLLYTFVR